MTNFGYNNRWIRLVKDLVFVAIAVFLMVRGRAIGLVVGLLFAYWYGRDAWFQAKALWQEKTYQGPSAGPSRKGDDDGPATTPPADDGKITVTDLSDAKDAEFRKEE